jgi:hypothetical protein
VFCITDFASCPLSGLHASIQPRPSRVLTPYHAALLDHVSVQHACRDTRRPCSRRRAPCLQLSLPPLGSVCITASGHKAEAREPSFRLHWTWLPPIWFDATQVHATPGTCSPGRQTGENFPIGTVFVQLIATPNTQLRKTRQLAGSSPRPPPSYLSPPPRRLF